MKYLMLGMITEAGQQLRGADLEAWMTEIGAWYEKHGSSGKLADAGHQLDWPEKAKTVRASGVTDGPFMEAKEVLGGYSLLETATIDEARSGPSWHSEAAGLTAIGDGRAARVRPGWRQAPALARSRSGPALAAQGH
jgi:hypothetical protein